MKSIVCVDRNWAIGNQNKLLVDIPADKKWFRELTVGGVVLGGRKTMESLPGGRTLADRINIVLTRQPDYQFGDAMVVHSLSEALETLQKYADDRIFIIGGGEVYRQFLPFCDHAYVTRIEESYEADTYFPNLDQQERWNMVQRSTEQKYQNLSYVFCEYRI